jgi:septum site-determining protein MinC
VAPKVQINGIREGLLVSLGDGTWLELQDALLKHVQQQAGFLHGARLALDVGNNALNSEEMSGLRDALSEKGLSLWAILSASPKTTQTAQSLGLATRLSRPIPERVASIPDTRLSDRENAILVKRTLRSGFSIKHASHVIVIGDVNPGAEIIAGGDVVVWGKLRGVVHAGADGDESAVVCALDLSPTQLRIAGQIALTPQRKGKPQPEIAHLQNGQVLAEAWNPKER